MAAILLVGQAVELSGGAARLLDVPADAALLAVLIGTSSDFLTPIGHQNNLLVMGPGGYRFTDYARMGGLLVMTAATILSPSPLSGVKVRRPLRHGTKMANIMINRLACQSPRFPSRHGWDMQAQICEDRP